MIPLCATEDPSVQRQSSLARRRVFRHANYEIRIELKFSRVQEKVCTKMFVRNPRALTSSNRFDAVACNANYVNASFFNNLLCPPCRNLIRHFHFVQRCPVGNGGGKKAYPRKSFAPYVDRQNQAKKLTLFYDLRAPFSATSHHRSLSPIESEGLQHTLQNSSLPMLIVKIRHES